MEKYEQELDEMEDDIINDDELISQRVDDVVSPLEIAIKDEKIKNKNKTDMDAEMLKDIEKTTIVKLSNQKSYKISPVRKKEKPKDEIELLDVI